jgi:predicted HAD superfamily Cof-like phosphohydrolase
MTLKEVITQVEKFHDAFGIKNHYVPETKLTDSECELRFNLMKEENEEYLEAAKRGDIVEIADALGDQLYILCGTILRHGLQDKIVEVFQEIQRSNMSKLDKDGKPIYREDGKVMKSELYFRPDIKSILEQK